MSIGEEPWLKHDTLDDIQLKVSLKEDEDFVLLSDPAWIYLYSLYGGSDIPRYSIEVATDDSSEAGKEYMIELFY